MSLNDFVILEKVGSGSFASVYKARRLIDQKIYALKKIDLKALGQREKNNALNQIRLLACLKSPFIIGYCESFFEQKLDSLCIAMEYADGGDLLKKIENHKKQKALIPEIQIWKIFLHLVYGLNELHSRSILHRDLKSQNVFIADQTYKIGDMNVSKIVKNGRLAQTQTGTPYYASPQVWNDQPYNEKSDIWSLGCILYEVAALRPPFQAKSMEKLFEQVNHAQIPKISKNYSKQLQYLIDQCLQKNPNLRPSTKSLLSNQTVKIYENMLIECKPNLDNYQKGNLLLKTIYMPASKKQLNDKLPQSNYKNDKNEQKSKELSKQLIKKISQSQKLTYDSIIQGKIKPVNICQSKQNVNEIQPVFSKIESLINQNKTEKKSKNKSINKNSSRGKERNKSKGNESSSASRKRIHSCRIFKGKQNKNISSTKDLNQRENIIARAQIIINSHKLHKSKTPIKQNHSIEKIIENEPSGKLITTETLSKQLKPKKLIFEQQSKQQDKFKETQQKKIPQDISKSPNLGQTLKNLSIISGKNHQYYDFHMQKDKKKIETLNSQTINITVDANENYQKNCSQKQKQSTQMNKINLMLGLEKLKSFYSKSVLKTKIHFTNKIKSLDTIYRLIHAKKETFKKIQEENNQFFTQKLISQNNQLQTSAKKVEIKRNRSRSIPKLEKPRQKNNENQQLNNFLLNKMSEKNLQMNQNSGRRQEEKFKENLNNEQIYDEKKIKQMVLLPPRCVNSVKKIQKENQIVFKDLPQYNQTDQKQKRPPLMDKNTYNILPSNQKSNKKLFPESIFSQGSLQFEQKKKRLFQSIQTSNNLVHNLNGKLDRFDLERRMKKYMHV